MSIVSCILKEVFKSVGTLLNSPQLGTRKRTFLALQARAAARKALGSLCGDLDPEIIESIRVASFDGNTLKISAPSLVCAELQMRSDGLIKEINRALGKKIVDKIRFKVG